MTADQVSKGMPDELLSTDTCAFLLPPAVKPSVQQTSHGLDQHVEVLSNTASVPVQSLDNVAYVTTGNYQLADVAQTDIGINCAIFPQRDQTVEDITVRSHPSSMPKSEIFMSESINVTKGTVEPAVTENAKSQKVIDDTGSICITESQSFKVSAGLHMIPKHCDEAAEIFTESIGQISLNQISTEQETKVLKSSQQCEYIAPIETVCKINSEINSNIGKTHSETSCNTKMKNESKSEIRDTESNTETEIGTIVDTAQNIDCEIKDSVEEAMPIINTEISDMIRDKLVNSDKLVSELPKPSTEHTTPVINQPSSEELTENHLEVNDSMLIMNEAISNPNGTSEDRVVDSTANLLQNPVTESKLFMTASESCVLEDPVPDRFPHFSTMILHQLESTVSDINDPVVDNMTKNKSDTNLRIPGFLHTSVETIQISEEAETDLSLPDFSYTSAIIQDIDSSCRGMEGDCSELTDAKYSDQLSNELWMDACQFLALEEDKGFIFDDWGHSPAPSPPRVSPDNTKPLAFSQGKGDMIGQLVGDGELPLVERWSSSDSWASALSDWFQSVSVFTEDSTLVATTSSCKEPTDFKTQPCMAIQDTTEDPKNSPESPSTTGQMYLPPGFMENRVDTQSKKVPKDEKPVLQSDKDIHLHSQLYTAGTQDLPGSSVVVQKEMKKEEETMNLSGSYKPNLESHLQEETLAPVLPIKECTVEKFANQHLSRTKPDKCNFQEVTEDRTSQLSPDFDGKIVRTHDPLRLLGYSNDKDHIVGCVHGPCLDIHCPELPSDTEHLTHAESVETDCTGTSHTPFHTEGSWSHGCLYTQVPEKTQGQGRAEDPVFVMPFAPVSIGTSFYHPCDFKEDQLSPNTFTKQSLTGLTVANAVDHTGCSPANTGGRTSGEESSDDQFHTCSEKSREQSSSTCGDSEESSCPEIKNKAETEKASDISCELSKLILLTGQRFMVSEEKRVAYVTLDLDDVLNFNKDTSVGWDQGVPTCMKQHNCEEQLHIKVPEMPHKTAKTSSEGKARSKHKEKMTQQLGTPTKKQEKGESHVEVKDVSEGSEDSRVAVIETIVITEKVMPKCQGKKKKKHGMPKLESEHLSEGGQGARSKATQAKSEGDVATLSSKPGKVKEKPVLPLITTKNAVSTVSPLKVSGIKQYEETEAIQANAAQAGKVLSSQESLSACPPNIKDDDLVKRRRISEEKSKAVPVRTRPQLPAIFRQKKEEEVIFKRPYSDVVKQKTEAPKKVVVPRVAVEIQAAPVQDDPQSISLWCQFSPVVAESSITWTKEGKVLSEKKRGGGDDSRVTLSILKACSKDLGMYCCSLTGTFGSVSTSEYHLTSEVLMELVIPCHDTPECREVNGEKEDVHCAPLLFRDNILTDQYFGENQPASIVTEKAHFGEGMHRKAFRTTLRAGMLPVFNPGHPCVLKVHNAISYGTKNIEELIQKNYNLAVEECHVQNTAREYIKAYTNVAKSADSFGEVPEIIPIYLVHRPSSDIPYATLEEELIGDFVKYSVKDGKEINLMRRDSEAGQKCCAFQHWVYSQTDGNLLVTDMQGVGMKLTDIGIATCKKGYKGFKGNCSTSFIDQFKALHQCNRFCEILGLMSLQPKPKRTVAPPKPKAQSVPKKKTFDPVLKGKS